MFQQPVAIQIGEQVFEECYALGLRKVLIDPRLLTGEISPVDKLEIAEAMATQQMVFPSKHRHVLRVTHVGSPKLIDMDGFGEDVAANRRVNTHVTSSILSALNWLGIGNRRSWSTANSPEDSNTPTVPV